MNRSMVMEFASRKSHSRQAFRRSRSGTDTVNQVWMGATVVAFIAIVAVGAGITFTGQAYPEGIQALVGLAGAVFGGLAGWAGFARG